MKKLDGWSQSFYRKQFDKFEDGVGMFYSVWRLLALQGGLQAFSVTTLS